jgi:hypothetical protein
MRSHDPEDEAIRPYRAPAGSAPRATGWGEAEMAPSIAKERLTTLLGQEVVEHRRVPIFSILLLISAAGAAAPSVMLSLPTVFLAAGIPAICFAILLWLTRPAPLTMSFSEEGITFGPAGYFLSYGRIQQVFAPERERETSAHFRILLLCDGGHLSLPSKLSVESEDVYQFLRSQPLGRHAIPQEVDSAFHQFLRQQLTVHGPEEITIYQTPQWFGWEIIGTSWRHNDWTRVALCMAVTGGVWLAAFGLLNHRDNEFLLVVGIIALVLAFVTLLLGLAVRAGRGTPKKFRNAVLIVSPSALALSQGDLKGELRWREIQKIKLQKGSSTAVGSHYGYNSSGVGPGVLITVKGALILIADVYHWPAEHIESLIRKHARL